ncbi:MAG: YetF domain-containing protein [Ilumatobacteraceae bacterium]
MDIVLRAAFVWVLLAVAMRVGGKREIAQMSAFDLIMLVTVGDLIGQTVMQEDYSLTAGVLAVGTFAMLALGLEYLTWRFPITQSAIEGRPSIIVRDGIPDLDVMHSERLPLNDLHEAARGSGIRDLRDIDLCVLETDGSFSFFTKGGSGDDERSDPGEGDDSSTPNAHESAP